MQEMPYTVVFNAMDNGDASATDATTAKEALAIIDALQRSHEEINFITSPHEGQIGVEMLRVLAKEEEEEMPLAMVKKTRPALKLGA